MNYRQIVLIGALCALCVCIAAPVLAETTPAPAAQPRDNATDYFNYAELAINNGQYDVAVNYFDMVLAENTTILEQSDGLMYTYKDKAAALADLGRYSEALKTANAGIILYPNSTGLWNNKGYILYKSGQFNDAVDAYGQAVTIDPTYVKGWVNKGTALNAAGRYGEAKEAFSRALALDPGNADATDGLALANKNAPFPSPVVIAVIIVLIVIAGGAFWHLRSRKPESAGPAKKADRK